MTGLPDVRAFVGQVHDVTLGGRTMTVAVGDGGPLKWWDHRPVVSLTVEFHDGRRSNWASADAAAGEVAAQLFAPYSVGVLGAGGWEPLIERSQRDTGKRRNGSTRFTFFVFQGPVDTYPDLDEMYDRGATLEEVLAAVAAHGRQRAGIAEVEARLASGNATIGGRPRRAVNRGAHAELMRELASR
jgi:hypothetical protein